MNKLPRWKISLYSMAALYIGGGTNHFLNPDFYLSVMPEWLPLHDWANWSSGIVEMILGLLLLPEVTRRFSAWMIIAMLTVFFFVIHIPMCFHFEPGTAMFYIALVRIPLQIVLINWALRYAQGRQWKFAKNRKQAAAGE